SAPRLSALLERVRRVLPRAVAAQARGGEDLPRVHAALGIERAAQQRHGGEVVLGEQLAHVGRLVGAHAMLAGDRSARADAGAEDLSRDLLRRLVLAVGARIVAPQPLAVPAA